MMHKLGYALSISMMAMTTGLPTVPARADVRADVKLGVDAWARGDFKAAVAQWRPAAIGGDADAQFNLGQAYKLGRGVPVDPALAESWFRKAAMQGHPLAEDNYAIALFEAGKRADAVPWLEKSVARDQQRTQLVYGTMLFNGDGVARDVPRAYALMTRASQQGSRGASETLTQMDQFISPADREKGTRLAQQYAAQARLRPDAAPPEPMPLPSRTIALPKASPKAAPPKPTTTSWRVQLGAFSTRAKAELQWTHVRGRMSGAEPTYTSVGDLTRLQAGGFPTRAAAQRACTAAATPCVVVAP